MERGIAASLVSMVKSSSNVACCMPEVLLSCFLAFLRTRGADRYASPLRVVATSDLAGAMPVLFPGRTWPASPAATSARESKPSCVMSPALFSAPRIGQQVGTTTRRPVPTFLSWKAAWSPFDSPAHRRSLIASDRALLPALDQYSIEKKRFTVGERSVRECGL